MSDEEFKNRLDYIGTRITGALFGSVIGVIWGFKYMVAWQVFGTILFLFVTCLVFSFAVEDKIKRNNK